MCCIKCFLSILYLDCCLLPGYVMRNPYCDVGAFDTYISYVLSPFLSLSWSYSRQLNVLPHLPVFESLCLFLNDPASDGAIDSQ